MRLQPDQDSTAPLHGVEFRECRPSFGLMTLIATAVATCSARSCPRSPGTARALCDALLGHDRRRPRAGVLGQGCRSIVVCQLATEELSISCCEIGQTLRLEHLRKVDQETAEPPVVLRCRISTRV